MSDWRKLWLPAHHSDKCRPARNGGGGGHHRDHQVRDTGGIHDDCPQRPERFYYQVDDDSSHFQIKNESVEYENGLDMKKVIVTKVSYNR